MEDLKPNFEKLITDVKRAAFAQKVDLNDSATPYTIWLEDSGYTVVFLTRARNRAEAQMAVLTRRQDAIIYGIEGETVQVVVWRSGKCVAEYRTVNSPLPQEGGLV
jgi:hypothetical protein